jgi:hypothetical protein
MHTTQEIETASRSPVAPSSSGEARYPWLLLPTFAGAGRFPALGHPCRKEL